MIGELPLQPFYWPLRLLLPPPASVYLRVITGLALYAAYEKQRVVHSLTAPPSPMLPIHPYRMTIFEDHLVRDINAGRFGPHSTLVLVTHGLAARIFLQR